MYCIKLNKCMDEEIQKSSFYNCLEWICYLYYDKII